MKKEFKIISENEFDVIGFGSDCSSDCSSDCDCSCSGGGSDCNCGGGGSNVQNPGLPDVCDIPSGTTPIPIPYPNFDCSSGDCD